MNKMIVLETWCSSTQDPLINLLLAFSLVLIMDCTYQPYSYKMPLLKIVGVTSTYRTFSITFSYLKGEKKNRHYTWALQNLKSLIHKNFIPRVLVINGEFALMNELHNVFSTSSHLLSGLYWKIFSQIVRNALSKKQGGRLLFSCGMFDVCHLEKACEYHLTTFDRQNQRYTTTTKYCKVQ